MLKTFDSGCVPAAQTECGNLPMCRGSDLTMISPFQRLHQNKCYLISSAEAPGQNLNNTHTSDLKQLSEYLTELTEKC